MRAITQQQVRDEPRSVLELLCVGAALRWDRIPDAFRVLPWLALVAMLVNVISGMTGKYLLDRSRRFLAEKKDAYVARGLSGEAIEKEMFWDATAVDLMKKWRAVSRVVS